jgi:glutamate dehydrogenase (NAD(P)+)
MRICHDPSVDELKELARTMTLKYGHVGVPMGGAKAAVRGDPEAPKAEKLDRLVEFGRSIRPVLITGGYRPGADMGTSIHEIRSMMKILGLQIKRREYRVNRSGYYTALSVRAAMVHVTGHVGCSYPHCNVAIEGLGAVGGALSRLLAADGVSVVAVSTRHGALYKSEGLDLDRVSELIRLHGSQGIMRYAEAERIDHDELLVLPVDILSPCAMRATISASNAPRIQAKAICPGANNPVTPEAEEVLTERGIVSVPEFIANSGGVLGSILAFGLVSESCIAALIEELLGGRVMDMLRESAVSGRNLRDIALPRTSAQFARMKSTAEQQTFTNWLQGIGYELHRIGLVPGFMMSRIMEYYVRHTFPSPAPNSADP